MKSITRRNKAILLVLFASLLMMLPSLLALPIDNNHSNIIQVEDIGNVDFSIISMNSESNRQPILVYSLNPVESLSVEITRVDCLIDQNNGKETVESIQSNSRTYDIYEYHIISGGNPTIHKSMKYYSEKGDNAYFIESLETEIHNFDKKPLDSLEGFTLSQFDGGYQADDRAWLYDQTSTYCISAVDDGDGWTWKQRYQQYVHRSVYDYTTGHKWWTINMKIMQYFDDGDYKADYANWVGPWMTYRMNRIYDWSPATEWDHGPESSLGSWDYSHSIDVKLTPSGATAGFGYSESWSQPSVYIDRDAIEGYELKWTEEFPPSSTTNPNVPFYGWYPTSLTPPLAISHDEFGSYRDILFWNNPTSTFRFGYEVETQVRYDNNFYYVFPFFVHVSHWYLSLNIKDAYTPYPATG